MFLPNSIFQFASRFCLFYTGTKAEKPLFFVENDKKKLNWKPAIEIFSQVSTWIVAPIILALVFGKMLDARYRTEPIIFLVLAGAGFVFTCFGIVRVIRKYIKEIQNQSKLGTGQVKDLSDKEN